MGRNPSNRILSFFSKIPDGSVTEECMQPIVQNKTALGSEQISGNLEVCYSENLGIQQLFCCLYSYTELRMNKIKDKGTHVAQNYTFLFRESPSTITHAPCSVLLPHTWLAYHPVLKKLNICSGSWCNEQYYNTQSSA